MNRAELKLRAKEQIKGKIGMLFVVSLIIVGISIVAGMIPVVGQVASFVISSAFSLSMAIIFLNVAAGGQVEAGDAFKGFNNLWGAIKVNFFMGLFTALWSLLFFIPGIVKAIAYSMSLYILAENPEMPALEAITRSKEMTKGHKGELFVLSLSFIGWMLLGGITMGIAYIWVMPYMETTFVNFYNKLKEETVVL